MLKNVNLIDNRRVHIPTSGRCNNNCLFCCDRSSYDGHLTLSRWFYFLYGTPFLNQEGFLKRCKKTKDTSSILFTGGEPTLNKDLISFVQLAKKAGYRNICIQTNGRLLYYKNFCVKLLENGVSEIGLSIHGSNKYTHGSLTRTTGAFEQAYRGLSNLILLKRKYRFKITTNFTITRLNYKDIYSYLKTILSLNKIDGVVLNTLMYAGNAKRFFNQLVVTYTDIGEEVKRAIDSLKRDRVDIGHRVKLSPMPFCLMVGYEDYVGKQETPLRIKGKRAEFFPRSSSCIKNNQCKLCKYYYICSGIDSEYAKRIGWSEIKAVK